MSDVSVAPGTIAVFADPGCPWAHVGVSRLHRARRSAGLVDEVAIDIRAFPLELINERPTPFGGLQSEIPPLQAIEPRAGWELWSGEASAWPVTMLPPMEAVEAAKEQGLEASAHLDHELRRAFFGQSRCISMRHVILEVAEGCGRVDVDALAEALDDGRARGPMLEPYWAHGGTVQGSPHVFLPDGTSSHNPGIEFHWDKRARRLVVDRDDPSAYDDLLRRVVG